MGLADKIHINLIPEEKLSLRKFVKEVASDFDKEEFLCAGTFTSGSSDGKFNSDIWIFENELSKGYIYINFNEMRALKFKNVDEEDILIVKCWLAEFCFDGYSPLTIRPIYAHLLYFLDTTKNFSDVFLKDNKGNNMGFLKTGHLDTLVFRVVEDIKSYIYYREDIGFKINLDTIHQYVTGLEALQNNLILYSEIRDIPKNHDALKFGYYVDTFFNDKQISQELKIFYMPVLIWWKVSNVIPIRPSELCTKMERECLITICNNLYLKINRVKRSFARKQKRALLPILDKLAISQEIYELIDNYRNLTNGYGVTKTLFSYKATDALRHHLLCLDHKKYSFLGSKQLLNASKNLKLNEEYFTAQILSRMLNSFYKNIIQNHYKDNSIKEFLSLHDTRHYAFTSLMLQGLTPVEIALLGGHTSLQAQDSYTSNVRYYIDSSVVNFVNSKKLGVGFSNKTLKEIVFSKPIDCPKSLEQCPKTEDNIGYCTADIDNEGLSCENETYCFRCIKWWCAPTEDNYDLLRRYIQEECITPLEEKMLVEEHFLQGIISKMNPVNIDGVLRSNVDEDREYKRLSMNLKSDVDELIDLKKILLDLTHQEQQQIE